MQTSTLAALEADLAEHPWRTLGGAFLLGAWVGLEPPHVPRNRIARAVFAMIGSMTIRVVRELALRELVGRTASSSRGGLDRVVRSPAPLVHDLK
jgi:hypothetical protein